MAHFQSVVKSFKHVIYLTTSIPLLIQVNHSGVLSALLQYLTGEEAEKEVEGEGRPRDAEGEAAALVACEERLRLFLHVFADMPLTLE